MTYITIDKIYYDRRHTNIWRWLSDGFVDGCLNFDLIFTLKFCVIILIRDRPFNLQGGRGLWFFVSFQIFFPDNTRVRIFIIFYFNINLTLSYMTKTLNQIFFPSTKIRIFFSATMGIRIFFFEKKHTPPPPPLQVKWSFPNRHYNLNSKQGYLDIHDPIKVVSFGPSLRYIIPPRNMEEPWPIADIEKIQILSE